MLDGYCPHFRRTLVRAPRSIPMTPHILIVEDDPLIAMDLEAIALEAGAMPACCATFARRSRSPSAAPSHWPLLDIDVRDGNTFPVARLLMQRNIPVTFVSAARPSTSRPTSRRPCSCPSPIVRPSYAP